MLIKGSKTVRILIYLDDPAAFLLFLEEGASTIAEKAGGILALLLNILHAFPEVLPVVDLNEDIFVLSVKLLVLLHLSFVKF